MRLFIDLDDVDKLKLPYKAFDNKISEKWKKRNKNTEQSIKEFLKQFVTYLLRGLKKSYKNFEVRLFDIDPKEDLMKRVRSILDDAAVSVKVDEDDNILSGIHIVLSNVIIHQASYSLMKDIIKWITKKVEQDENKHPFFNVYEVEGKKESHLDFNLFKERTRLRTIYSVKDEADSCKNNCDEFPCLCIRNKVYIPIEILNNNISDKFEIEEERLKHYFTYIHKEDIRGSLHFELIRKLSDRELKKIELLAEKGKDEFKNNSHAERKLAAAVPLLDFGNYDHRVTLSRFVYLNAYHLRSSLEHWFEEMGASDHMPTEITYNWDSLWPNKADDYWQVGWGHLINKMKENNEEGYKEWARKYSTISRKELNELKTDIEKLIDKFTHNDIAHDYKNAFPDTVLYQFGQWYVFNQGKSRWTEVELFIDDIAKHYKPQLEELIDQYLDERDKEEYNSSEWKAKDALLQKAKKAYKNICSVSFRKDIMTELKQDAFYKNEKLEFDTKWNLRGFENKVLDLTIGDLREYKKEDYITKSTGYDWREPEEDELIKLRELIERIQPDPEDRKCLLSILSTSLVGQTLEKFSVFNGGGRNGKGLIDELLLDALGCNDKGYAYKGPISVLSQITKDGPCPEKANMDKKTFVVFSEASTGRNCKFNNSWIKDTTGGSRINARKCHSNKTEVRLMCTMVVECNRTPKFQEPITNAERARLIDVYFPCHFTDNELKVDEKKLIYKADPQYKTQEFRDKYKYALIRILLDIYKELKGAIYIPESVRKRTSLYLSLSHWFIDWFNDNYEYVEKDTSDYSKYKNKVLSIKNLIAEIKSTEYFDTLSKEEKRECTIKRIVEEIENSVFGDHYIDAYDNNKTKDRERIKHVIIGFRKRYIDEEDD